MSEGAAFLLLILIFGCITFVAAWRFRFIGTGTVAAGVVSTMPCHDCQRPIRFSYCFDGSVGRCNACYEKRFDDFQARMVNAPTVLAVQISLPVTMAQAHNPPTRLYSLESDVRDDA
jgi:hypothetical protein